MAIDPRLAVLRELTGYDGNDLRRLALLEGIDAVDPLRQRVAGTTANQITTVRRSLRFVHVEPDHDNALNALSAIEAELGRLHARETELTAVIKHARELVAEGHYCTVAQAVSGVGAGNRLRDALDALDAPPADLPPAAPDDPWPLLTKLRDAGWSVAIHNDYWQNGIRYSFWLFTNKDTGRYVKGEAHTDFEALTRALALATAFPEIVPTPADPAPEVAVALRAALIKAEVSLGHFAGMKQFEQWTDHHSGTVRDPNGVHDALAAVRAALALAEDGR
jgi:hypothetical protein